jgi:hypothetical protein
MKKTILLLALIAIFVSSCSSNQPVAQNTPQASAVVATATAVPPTPTASPVPPSATPAPTATSTPHVTLFPTVTFAEKVVCRQGTDVNYYPVVTYKPGQTSQAQGRSEDSLWLVVDSQAPNKNPTCWVPVASVEDLGDISPLMVSSPPPLPVGPYKATTTKGMCGINDRGAIVVEWSPVVGGSGYYVYRNGKNIATVYGGQYIDHDTPGSRTPYIYTYIIQAFNSSGLSKTTAGASVTLCD